MGIMEWSRYQTVCGALVAFGKSDDELAEEDETYEPLEPEERRRLVTHLEREKKALETLHWNDLHRQF